MAIRLALLTERGDESRICGGMYRKTVLGEGLRVITSVMPHTRSVCLAFFVGSGSCYEREEEAGISHFVEHMCFKGTGRRPTAKEISQDIEGVGGIINASTGEEMTLFWCKVASAHFPLALDVLSDLLLNPRLDAGNIERERQVIIEEINMNMDIPQQRVNMLIDELLWPEQPLGREIIGSKETVAAITREGMVKHLARWYLPNNIVVSVAGNIKPDEVVGAVESVFRNLTAGRVAVGYPTDSRQDVPRLRLEHKDSEQVHLCLGVHGVSYSQPQRFTLGLLNAALGVGMSSRLFVEVREKKGLAYDIHSYVEHFRNSGSWVVYAGIDPNKVEAAVATIMEELARLREGITPEELRRAKELSKGRMQLRLEDSQDMSSWLGSQELLRGGILDMDEVISIVDAITGDEVREVAREVLNGNGLNLALVGPVKEEEPLEGLLKL